MDPKFAAHGGQPPSGMWPFVVGPDLVAGTDLVADADFVASAEPEAHKNGAPTSGTELICGPGDGVCGGRGPVPGTKTWQSPG
ncbi:hypothetical protein BJ956_003113 [Arthrobacter psychrochitiniphilus]|nr:hypothetical protein [Arthrobacter psychrochitiniphilus]